MGCVSFFSSMKVHSRNSTIVAVLYVPTVELEFHTQTIRRYKTFQSKNICEDQCLIVYSGLQCYVFGQLLHIYEQNMDTMAYRLELCLGRLGLYVFKHMVQYCSPQCVSQVNAYTFVSFTLPFTLHVFICLKMEKLHDQQLSDWAIFPNLHNNTPRNGQFCFKNMLVPFCELFNISDLYFLLFSLTGTVRKGELLCCSVECQSAERSYSVTEAFLALSLDCFRLQNSLYSVTSLPRSEEGDGREG